ncbi:hypothetical protein [Actinopolymorpha singaporensis]|uniref:Uncharacterized protein n=1 Tax=Actinopolymorpha singaporensis TaxID=117157 RepID=A0A1H1V750_9ACTN|nr:hypothetical protein [Actinopolymorpha singaporensis]SDS80552.1 hypothetical protein SAMN04489717_3938 [Actinopolymorpha singaporensis]
MRNPRLVLAALLVPAALTVAASAPTSGHSISFRYYDSGDGGTGADQCAKPLSEREGGWACYEVDPSRDDSASTRDWHQPGD